MKSLFVVAMVTFALPAFAQKYTPVEQLNIKVEDVDNYDIHGEAVTRKISNGFNDPLGLQISDIIIAVDEKPIRSTVELIDCLKPKKSGSQILVKVLRYNRGDPHLIESYNQLLIPLTLQPMN